MPDAVAERARKLPTLRAYLAALAAAVLLPALGVGAAAVWTAVQGQRAAFENGLRDTARALAAAVDAEVAGVGAALAAFVTSPAFGPDPAAPDLAAVDAQARRIAGRIGAALYLARRDGTRLVTTRAPGGTPLPPLAGRELVERVFATRRPALGNLVIGSVSGVPTIALGVPVFDQAGQVVLMAGASFDATRLSDLLAARGRDGAAFAALVDAADVIVARSRDHDRFVGQRVLDWVLTGTQGREGGLMHGPKPPRR
ncbi:cache domain-containing protein [Dankookia sp. P2]|uniref:cache domain-containing protein n=1 Tax=Dankookia sp. P2 TaxID=3423955 RepID=UPI003D678919